MCVSTDTVNPFNNLVLLSKNSHLKRINGGFCEEMISQIKTFRVRIF